MHVVLQLEVWYSDENMGRCVLQHTIMFSVKLLGDETSFVMFSISP